MDYPDYIDKSGKVRPNAFYRKRKDTDGVTVLPYLHSCADLNHHGVAEINVGAIEELENNFTAAKLTVIQDEAKHAYIDNLPYQHEHQEAARTIAIELAMLCRVVSESEIEFAVQEEVRLRR